MSAPSPKYLCPHCQKASRLPEPIPREGKFQLTCAHCSEKVILNFTDYRFEILQVVSKEPSVSDAAQTYQPFKIPTPSISKSNSLKEKLEPKSKPFWERKVVFEREPEERKFKPKPLKQRITSGKAKQSTPSFWKITFAFTSICLFLMILGFSYFVAGVLSTKKEVPLYLESLSKNIPTKILDRNGQMVSEIFQKELPPYVCKTIQRI